MDQPKKAETRPVYLCKQCGAPMSHLTRLDLRQEIDAADETYQCGSCKTLMLVCEAASKPLLVWPHERRTTDNVREHIKREIEEHEKRSVR